MKNTNKFVDKFYRLKRDSAPLSFMLASRNSRRFPLLHFDETEGVNKPLRYARNQRSPFEEEQDGNAILEPIVFEDGFLFVRKENQVLQQFLHFHPENGTTFSSILPQRLDAEIPEFNSYWGLSVSIYGDWIVIGAPYDDSTQTAGGWMELFHRNNSGT